MLPVTGKVGGSMDRVNGQLDKVDRITDSAVDGRRESDLLDELREAGT
jgi:predicted N-acetyltransferase YhbS